MGTPRFRPVEVFSNPRHFGRVPDGTVRGTTALEPRQVAWALFQHKAALAVREELENQAKTVSDLAVEIGEGESWLRRKLHGQVPADLGDVMAWALVLGVQVLPAINDLGELGP